MYVSYPLSCAVIGIGLLTGYLLLPDWRLEAILGLAAIAYLPFIPLVFRASRVIWIHFERWSSPGLFDDLGRHGRQPGRT
jgi:hypothetical protein